jgi:hypothetical protein
MSNSHLIRPEIPACARCRADPGCVSAGTDAAGKTVYRSHSITPARHRCKTFAQVFHTRIDLVGGAEVEDEPMVVAAVDHRFETARQFGAPLCAEPARIVAPVMEHSRLQ